MSTDQVGLPRHDTSSAVSRPSQNKCQDADGDGANISDAVEIGEDAVDSDDLYGETGLRPLTANGESLRPEAAMVKTPNGAIVPADYGNERPEGEILARPWYKVVRKWRSWYQDYESTHITFQRDDGKIGRTKLRNSYQPAYGDKYYAKTRDFERAVEREYGNLTTAMLTLSASTLNANGNPRCPADHMREIADGWQTARKQLYHALDGHDWEYARVWEPTSEDGKGPAGYGHMHVAVFVDCDETEVNSGTFESTLRTYTDSVQAAGWDAHRPDGNSVSLNYGVNNLGSYITEYIGSYGERAVDREMREQQFYAVTWATGTRRVSFSQGANEMIADQQFRRETGLRPEDRGQSPSGEDELAHGDVVEQTHTWEPKCICHVRGRRPHRTDPTTGGVEMLTPKVTNGDPPPVR